MSRELCSDTCTRYTEVIMSPCLQGIGPVPAKIMLIGEAPGQVEDTKGEPFVGSSGRLLDELLEENNLNRKEMYITNCVKCATKGENRTPTKKEIRCCRNFLVEEIKQVKPMVIAAIGGKALESVLGKSGITKIKNQVYFSEEFQTKVVVIYHPAYALRNPGLLPDLRNGFKLLAKEATTTEIIGTEKMPAKYLIADTKEKIQQVLSALEKVPVFAMDFETTSLNYLKADIVCISVSWASGSGITIPWNCLQGEERERLLAVLASDKLKIGQNIKYDIEVAIHNKIKIRGPFFDVMLAHSLIDENSKHGLDDMTLRYLDMGEYWAPLEAWKKERNKTLEEGEELNYGEAPKDLLYPYAAKDADATYRLYPIFKSMLDVQKLSDFFVNHTMPMMESIIQMEYHGVLVDREKLGGNFAGKFDSKTIREISDEELKKYGLVGEYTVKSKEVEKEIYTDAAVKSFEDKRKKKASSKLLAKFDSSKTLKTRYGTIEAYCDKMLKDKDWKVNLNSPKQLGELLFGKDNLNLAIIKTTDKNKPSVDAEVLEYFAEHATVPFAKALGNFRVLGKYLSTYLIGIYNKSYFDGRIHAEYLQAHTVTGRLSSKEPNMQNIPRNAKDLKECFVTDPGYIFVKSDLAQAEFRCWAHYSNDEDMIRDIESGMDIHKKIASEIFGIPEEKIDKNSIERTAAKNAVFGLMYGRGAAAIAAQYNIELDQAQEIKNLFFARYPKAKRWLQLMREHAHAFKQVKSWLGRIRRLPMIDSDNQGVTSEAERQAMNCIDFKTEVLTKRGWISGWDVSLEDYILTKNENSDILEWQKPTIINRYGNYYGPICHINSKSFSAATTPNHRWLVFNGNTNKNECRTSGTLYKNGSHRIHRTGKYIKDISEYTKDSLISLIGWILTDGSFLTSKYTGDAIVITQSYRANIEKVAKIEFLLNDLNILYSRCNVKESCCYNFKFFGPLANFIRSVIPNKKLNTTFLLSLSTRQLQLLFDAMIDGDGWVDKYNKTSFKTAFYTADEKEADAFQFLCVLLGKASSKRFDDLTKCVKKNALKCKKMHNIPSRSYRWTVNVLHRDKVQVLPGQYKVLKEHRGVWCPTIPNSYFVARRNGFVYITGNSPIQSLASDMNNHYMCKTLEIARNEKIKCYPVTIIHDANVFEVIKGKELELSGIMKRVVETAFPGFRCKMKLDFEIGETLGTLKEVTI